MFTQNLSVFNKNPFVSEQDLPVLTEVVNPEYSSTPPGFVPVTDNIFTVAMKKIIELVGSNKATESTIEPTASVGVKNTLTITFTDGYTNSWWVDNWVGDARDEEQPWAEFCKWYRSGKEIHYVMRAQDGTRDVAFLRLHIKHIDIRTSKRKGKE